MNIESPTFSISTSAENLYDFLIVPAHLEQILPTERIHGFEADGNKCHFKIQGGIVISLVLAQTNAQCISYTSGDISPFPFQLDIRFKEESSKVTGHIVFEGEVAPFIAMVAKSPLTALFTDMAENLRKVLE